MKTGSFIDVFHSRQKRLIFGVLATIMILGAGLFVAKSTEAATDVTPPVIILNGSASATAESGSVYTDLGATASDDVDGDITVQIITGGLPVNTSSLGGHSVTYDVSDAAGNAAVQVSRLVDVVDTTGPVITLVGSNPQTIVQGNAYAELGATYTDNHDDPGNAVADSSSVNTNVVGSYTVTYNKSDASGNAAVQVTRTVNVTPGSVIVVMGCTNSSATNFNALATQDDGSCTFAPPSVTSSSSATSTNFLLNFSAGAHGSLTGSTTQSLANGSSTSAVTAVADAGFHFVDWSDGNTTNPRTDTNVSADLSVTANFEADSSPLPPSGHRHTSSGSSGGGSVSTGQVLGASIEPTRAEQIQALRMQIILLIAELIKQLQIEIAAQR